MAPSGPAGIDIQRDFNAVKEMDVRYFMEDAYDVPVVLPPDKAEALRRLGLVDPKTPSSGAGPRDNRFRY
jgi:hypothetical protein